MTKTFQPGLFSRLMMAAKLVTRGGAAEVVDHFRRAGSSRLNGGPPDPHQQVVAVFRCVQFLAESVSYLPFMVSTQDDRVIESGPVADLLDKPNPLMSIEQFWQQTIGWMLLSEHGNAYWVFTKRIGGRPVEIVPVGDAQVRPITDNPVRGTGEVVAWEYRPAGTRWDQAERLELDEVWRVSAGSCFDADRPWCGTPVLNVIRRAINQVYKSDIANEASLDNGVEPGGVLILDGTPTPEQENDIKSAMDERRGAANRRRHLVLKGNIKWEQIAASFTDMEFEKLKRYSRADVCAGFGLDPSAVGFPPEGGRFEYTKAAKDDAWISRVLPLCNSIAAQFDRGVLTHYEADQSQRMYKALDAARPMRRAERAFAQRNPRAAATQRRLYAWFDGSVVEAVKELYKSRVETGAKMVRDLKATPEEAGDLLDLGLTGNDAQKLIWQSTSEMPFDPIQPGDDDPPGSPGPGSNPGPQEDDEDGGVPGNTGEEDTVGAAFKDVTDAQLAQIHNAWRRSWSPIEKAMQSRVSRHFNNLRGIVLSNLDKSELTRGTDHPAPEPVTYRWTDDDGRTVSRTFSLTPVRRDLLGEILFDLVEANGKLRVLVSPLVRQGFELGGKQAMSEHVEASDPDGEPDVFNIQDPEVASAMRRREIKLTDVNKTVRNRLRAQIAEALEANEPVGKVAERIRKEFNLASARSKTIARTEVGRSVEEARHLGREQAGTPLKSWLWSRRETGRPWHQATERATLAEPVANDELFTLAQTGNTCPHPRATNDPQDDINCGCTTIARFPGDSVKAVVLRYTERGFVNARKEPHDGPADQ